MREGSRGAVEQESEASGKRRQTAERLDPLLALPVLVLSFALIVILVLPVAFPDLPPGASSVLAPADLAAFLAEYLDRRLVAPDQLAFICQNPFDLLLAVIPMRRPLRLLRSVQLVRAGCFAPVGAGAGRTVRESRIRLASRGTDGRWLSGHLDPGGRGDGTGCGVHRPESQHHHFL